MLLTIKNYTENKLEQKFINDNFAKYNYSEYTKTLANTVFEKVKNEEQDFLLIKDSSIFKGNELNDLRNKLKQFGITGIFIDNNRKYDPNLEKVSDYMIQICRIDNQLTSNIIKCANADLRCFPFINPKSLIL